MGGFDETLIAAADCMFLLPGAEAVTYMPRSGDSRRINAVVTRPGPEQMAAIEGGSRPQFELLVKNTATGGIASDELDTGGDKIEVAPREGAKPVTMRLIELLDHDAGCCRILAQ